MIDGKRIITVLIVLLLLGSLPGTALAQGGPQNVLLDQETEQIATVTVEGQTYTVYRIENVIWYASGIDIYADGQRVRSESTARQVLTKLARRRAVKDLGPADLTVLRTAKRNVSNAEPAVAAVTRDINDTLVHLEALKSEQVDGRTAYNAAVEAAPGIVDFNESAQELGPRLDSFENDSRTFIENASTLIELVERRENGSSVDPQHLYDVYVATIRANEALSEHLGFNGVNEALSELSATSEMIAMNVSSVPETGNETARHFDRMANSSGTAANMTQAIELPGFEFQETRDQAESLESDWMDRWQSRQNAGTDVYYSIFGLIAVVGLLAGYIGLRRR